MTYRIFKRTMDIVFSLLTLIIIAPLFIPIMLVLRFSAEGEVFYMQRRIGYQNKAFSIIKFATMMKNSLNMGTGSITLRNDPRVTKPGKFLRKTKLNEVPQLINIVMGDISFVGPRPILESDFKLYSRYVQGNIYRIKPGLTGIGSIVFRDEEELLSRKEVVDPHKFYKEIIAPYKGDLELWYQQNMSFFVDLKLLILTFLVVLSPKIQYQNRWFTDLPPRNF